MNDQPVNTRAASDEQAQEPTRLLGEALAACVDSAFEGLVRAYQQRIYAFVLRLTATSADAEEIAQDTFVRAYRALASYPPERIRALALRPWLYQIALNLARNRARDTRHERQLTVVPPRPREDPEEPAAIEPEDDPALRPEALAEASEARRELAAKLAELPTRYRAAVVLRHVEGFSYSEMAELLGQPIGTVKANVHRGVRLLRASLVPALEGVEG